MSQTPACDSPQYLIPMFEILQIYVLISKFVDLKVFALYFCTLYNALKYRKYVNLSMSSVLVFFRLAVDGGVIPVYNGQSEDCHFGLLGFHHRYTGKPR